MTDQRPSAATEPWLNDTSEYQQCFACGQRNPFGLHLHYATDGKRILTTFTGEERHMGFPGVVHGGILATILDETMGRISVFEERWVMTARLDLRYRAPAPIGMPLQSIAEVIETRSRMIKVKGWIASQEHPDLIFCEADGIFMPLPDSIREDAMAKWPDLESFFRKSSS